MSGYRIPVTSFLLTNVESIQNTIRSISIGEILDIHSDNHSNQICVYRGSELCGYIHKNTLQSGIIPERVKVFEKESSSVERGTILTLRVVPIHRGREP